MIARYLENACALAACLFLGALWCVWAWSAPVARVHR